MAADVLAIQFDLSLLSTEDLCVLRRLATIAATDANAPFAIRDAINERVPIKATPTPAPAEEGV